MDCEENVNRKSLEIFYKILLNNFKVLQAVGLEIELNIFRKERK